MESRKPNILIAASEATPLAKVGGLGDVTGSLPVAFKDMGCQVAVVLPAYREALDRAGDIEIVARDIPVPMGDIHLTADILKTEIAQGVPAYLVRRDEFFDRSELYGNIGGEYFDNRERYIFFSKTIPALCRVLGLIPDILLCNDWQTGLVMALLNQGAMTITSGVFAIHNMGYLGLVPPERTGIIGLSDKYYRMEGLEYYGRMSLLKAGIVYADAVVTVSPTYAREIQTPEFGAGLDGLMRSVKDRLFGILNGVDYAIWNPAIDRHIAANYSVRDLDGKARCKQDLLKQTGLPETLMDKPLIGMVTRLVEQKGCGLVAKAARDIFEMDAGLVLLGDGDEPYQELFRGLEKQQQDRFALRLGFDRRFAHKIFAGSDMFLIPSLYEPCGLTQMFSLKYGTIPIVRATGGLQDTIIDQNEGQGIGTGFKFSGFETKDLARAALRAAQTFNNKEEWNAMILKAMEQDFSWKNSAREYLDVFQRAIHARKRKINER